MIDQFIDDAYKNNVDDRITSSTTFYIVSKLIKYPS